MDRTEIEKLGSLAHIRLSESDAEKLGGEIAQILAYVSMVKEVSPERSLGSHRERNVMREDGEPDPAGLWSEKLLDAAPRTRGSHIATKKILSND